MKNYKIKEALFWLEINNIELPQNFNEFNWLLKEISKIKPKSYLEIGSREGGSLYIISQALSAGSQVISIDLPNGPWGKENSLSKLNKVIRKLQHLGCDANLIIGNSHDQQTFKKVQCLIEKHLDVLFIDGDHTYWGVKNDWSLYMPLVKSGGIVAFHDLIAPLNSSVEVYKLWNCLIKDYNYSSFIEEWGIGVIYV